MATGAQHRPVGGATAPDLLHRAVAASAERTPDAPAFRFLEETLSYARLAERAGRLAGCLRRLGVRRGDRVGLYLNKSLESAVALFGAMQAGAAYVPLDPAAPAERTRRLLDHCAAKAVITHEPRRAGLFAALDGAAPLAVVGLDDAADAPDAVAECVSWAEALSEPEAPLLADGASELDLAYIIFTSGSTGEPKGIMHTHQSGMAYARMSASLYGLRPDDRLSNVSPLHFDMSTFDYFSGPLAGAMTVIISDAHAKLPASLSELAERERLTIWYSVPFALTQMLLHGALEARDLSALRWVLFGGEPFTPKHLAALTRRLPGARFSNVYGPAEVNHCTYEHLDDGWEEADGQPPIGRACPNADVVILDDQDQEASRGAVGELVVRAPTMMRGYWRRPELNARVFLRRAGAGGVEDVWLRTGDLVEELPSGALRFAGRKDRQVKTRGYRVELDEVEDALATHDAVAEAAAFPAIHGEGLTLIEAAATMKPGRAATPDELTLHLRARLPSYATPARIQVLDAFPRTTSGKIDRRRLSEDAARPATE